jgi:cellulose synthase/poly-beta-1,6-N-acetylglucosamine synthase-like glycosyltransferase
VVDFPFFFFIFRVFYYIAFVGLHAALMLGIFLEWLRDRGALKKASGESQREAFPREELPQEVLHAVSIIVPVHNEKGRIEALLKSLAAQDYPKAELIFVDDRSTDGSAALISRFIEALDPARFDARIVSLSENPGPNFKQYALARGIEAASGEFLLFTDADCAVPPSWIRGMAARLSDSRIGAAIGPVLKRPGGKGFFHLYQCYEHGVRYVYLAGAVGLGAAGGGFGNNLILRRSCLDMIGGYDSIPPSPTEDAALVSKIRSSSKYRIRAAVCPDVHVITQGEANWRDLIKQTLRWNNGGLFCPDPITRINYSFLMITISLGVLAFPFLLFFPFIWLLPLGPVTVMILNTIANLGLFGVSLPGKRFGFGYLLTLLFMPVYMTLMTVMGYLGIKPDWKGQKV